MNCEITATPDFNVSLKKLCKRHKSLKEDFALFIASLRENPVQGVDLGGGIRKIRLAISSKGRGKSGGARVITCNTLISVEDMSILLLAIYDKADRSSITDKEIRGILKRNGM